jgi:hypothetical protein
MRRTGGFVDGTESTLLIPVAELASESVDVLSPVPDVGVDDTAPGETFADF